MFTNTHYPRGYGENIRSLTGIVSPGFPPPTCYQLSHLGSSLAESVAVCPVSERSLRDLEPLDVACGTLSRLVLIGETAPADAPVRSDCSGKVAVIQADSHGSTAFSNQEQPARRYAFRCKGADFLAACDDAAIYLRERAVSRAAH